LSALRPLCGALRLCLAWQVSSLFLQLLNFENKEITPLLKLPQSEPAANALPFYFFFWFQPSKVQN